MIERWELVPSSRMDRYILKVRGAREDMDKIVAMFARVCQEPREFGDPVYQWAAYVVDATLNERLAIQDQLRSMMSHPVESRTPAAPADLSGVLAELALGLEELTGLTEEEQARAAQKIQQIQQREAEHPLATPVDSVPMASVAPSPAPPAEPVMDILKDVVPPPRSAPPLEKEPSVPKLTAVSPAPSPASSGPVTETPPPDEPGIPQEQLFRTAWFYPAGSEAAKEKCLKKLKEISQVKAKKPIFIQPVWSRDTTAANSSAGDWIASAKAMQAQCVFVMLPPDVLPDFLDAAVAAVRQAGLSCFLIPIGEIDSRLLYVDLMVELMMVKHKK